MSAQTAEPIAIADLMHHDASRKHVAAAWAFVAVLTGVTAVGACFGGARGPVLPPFIPICATLWGSADLLTAFLLLTQFSVNGIRACAVLGAAYLIAGLLTVGYVGYFPLIFQLPPYPAGIEQVSLWLWIAWHLFFPLIVGAYHLADPLLDGRVLRAARIRSALIVTAAGTSAFGLAVIGALGATRAHLPVIVRAGHFTPLYTELIAPAVVVASIAAALIVVRSRRRSALQIWLAVALVTAALDATLNAFSSGRYSISWYVGKFETLCSASVVLVILLAEVNVLYRRLGSMAMLDALTGLRNRRSFDADANWVIDVRARTSMDVAMLVIDIDFFKLYNDRYGHQGGDACLRSVAASIRETCGRATDLVARYGGEEFVVLLSGSSVPGAAAVAERVRAGVAALAIPHAGSSVATVVTISIGVAGAAPGTPVTLDALFARADAALYEAKRRRNTVVATAIERDGERNESRLAPA